MYLFVDWITWFYPRCHGLKPLTHYPPWAYGMVCPIAVFPPMVGALVLAAISVLVAYRYMGWRVLLLVSSPPALMVLLHGNVDLVMVGTLMAPLWLGVVIASCKPIVWTGYVCRRLLREGLISALPVLLLLTLTFTLGMSMDMGDSSPYDHGYSSGNWLADYSVSLFPWSVPVGALMILSPDPVYWMLGSGLVLPYFQFYHLVPVLAVYLRRRPLWKCLILLAALWAYTMWRWA